jgi:tripartite-type tricarboxylate transporter receptor subunit TctC
MSIRAILIASGLTLAASLILPIPVEAQTYPARAITLVVPNLPGGSSDLIARAVGAKLQESLGRPVVIENKPGASEMIASESLARSAPDGYTIAILSNALAINEGLSTTRRYEALRDLVPVVKLAELPLALIVSSYLPVNSLKEFVLYAKANPGKLSYGHVGVGAPQYLTMEWFKRVAGIDVLAVPYKSSAPVYTALLGGEIQLTAGTLGGAVQFIETGKVKALAAMSTKRPSAVPNLPTVSETGYAEFDLVPWMGIFAAAGTPTDILRKLETEIVKAAANPDVREQLRRVGIESSPAGTADFTAIVKKDISSWAQVIKDVGAKAE